MSVKLDFQRPPTTHTSEPRITSAKNLVKATAALVASAATTVFFGIKIMAMFAYQYIFCDSDTKIKDPTFQAPLEIYGKQIRLMQSSKQDIALNFRALIKR